MSKILFVHLLNDYSGSPKVLSQVILGVLPKHNLELYTAKGEKGFLNHCVTTHHQYSYQRYNNKILTLISLIFSQVNLFIKIVRRRKSYSTVYVNTMLPFGAGLAGKICRKKVIYHIHETSIKPKLFKKFLRAVIQKTASKIIFVSKSLHEKETFSILEEEIIYNALQDKFFKQAQNFKRNFDTPSNFRVLMICSLKEYKGVLEFVEIAKICKSSNISFSLILNSNKNEIDKYFSTLQLPSNMKIWSKQSNVHFFYEKASIVLNLSRPDQWVETFGLTIIEALAYGLPVIVPPVGGPAEIVREGREGYLISCYDKNSIAKKIIELSQNKKLYQTLSENALNRAQDFNETVFHEKILSVINE